MAVTIAGDAGKTACWRWRKAICPAGMHRLFTRSPGRIDRPLFVPRERRTNAGLRFNNNSGVSRKLCDGKTVPSRGMHCLFTRGRVESTIPCSFFENAGRTRPSIQQQIWSRPKTARWKKSSVSRHALFVYPRPASNRPPPVRSLGTQDERGLLNQSNELKSDVVPAKAGTHTPCPLDRLPERVEDGRKRPDGMGPGSSAGTTPKC